MKYIILVALIIIVACGTDKVNDFNNGQYPIPPSVNGKDGLQGPKGDTGQTGAQGEQGLQGPQGNSASISKTTFSFVNTTDCHLLANNQSAKRYSSSNIRVYLNNNCTADYTSYSHGQVSVLDENHFIIFNGSGASMKGVQYSL